MPGRATSTSEEEDGAMSTSDEGHGVRLTVVRSTRDEGHGVRLVGDDMVLIEDPGNVN